MHIIAGVLIVLAVFFLFSCSPEDMAKEAASQVANATSKELEALKIKHKKELEEKEKMIYKARHKGENLKREIFRKK